MPKAGDTWMISRPELDVSRLSAIIVSRSNPERLPIRLDQVADLSLGAAPRQSIRRIDGLNAVALDLERTRGSHMINVAKTVNNRIEDLQDSLPEGTRLMIVMDRTEDVRELLDDLALRGGIGLILVTFVLLFMLKSVRATVIVFVQCRSGTGTCAGPVQVFRPFPERYYACRPGSRLRPSCGQQCCHC